MRGLAVLVVVLFHAGLAGVIGGFVGVDVFFVISGFLITGLLLREHERTGRIELLQFYARRVRRLLPAAMVVLVVTLVVAINLVAPLDRTAIGLDAAASALSIGNMRFALAAGDYFATIAAPSPFLHFWSLAVEEQFYLAWPALILLVARGVHARRRVLIALLAVSIASFAANLIVVDGAANWAFYSLPTRAWELGLGGLLAAGPVAMTRIPGSVVGFAGWLGLGAIAIATLTFDSSLAYPGIAAMLPSLGAVALIAGGSRRLGPGRLLSVKPLRFLGKVSYSLYLVHWPILVLAPLVIESEPDDLTRFVLVGLSVAAAFATWALVENPFRAGLPQLALRPGRTMSIGFAAVLAVVMVAASPSLGMPPVDTVAAAEPASPVPSDAAGDTWVDETPTPTRKPTTEPSALPSATPARSALPSATPAGSAGSTPSPIKPAHDLANSGALPANVQPALADARADEERLRLDHCLAWEQITVPADCVYGNRAGTVTIALVGDSHAAHWFPALERFAKHEGWRLVTFVKVACPFIDMPVGNTSLKREYRECADFNEATIARLKGLKPDLTLISMSRIAIHPVDPGDDTVAAKGVAVARMVARVPGETAIIVDTPYAGRDVPACLSLHQENVAACAIVRTTAFSHRFGDVEAVAAKASGAGLIDLTARICVGRDACPVVVNGLIVYRDTGHMTATFSRSLAPALGAAILGVLGD